MALVAFTTRANLVANAVENIADVTNCLDKLLVGVNAIESANIVDATVTDTDLASPANAVWRTLQTWDTGITGGTTAGLYYAALSQTFGLSGGLATTGIRQYLVSAADSAVAGKTTRYRWAYNYVTNGVAPNAAVTLDVRVVTGVAGASSNSTTVTLGAATAGPAVTFTPSSPGIAGAASTGVAIADGTYVLGITLGGTTAATSYMALSVSLQMQHV